MKCRYLIRSVLILFVGLPALLRPANGRTWVECADGSACVIPAAGSVVHDCCLPHACGTPAVPKDSRCVVRTTPASLFISSRAPQNPRVEALPYALPCDAIASLQGGDPQVRGSQNALKPPEPIRGRGISPRGPPVHPA